MPEANAKRRRAAFDRGDVGFERGAGRVLGARVLVALVLAELVLHVGRGLEDGRDDRAGAGIGLLSGVDADGREARARREFHALIIAHGASSHAAACRRAAADRAGTAAPDVARPPVPRRRRGSSSSSRSGASPATVPDAVRVVSSAATVGLAIAVGVFAWRLFVQVKRRLLWRVRRKLILSYIFIGVDPVAADPRVLPVRRQPRVHERQRLPVQGRLRRRSWTTRS